MSLTVDPSSARTIPVDFYLREDYYQQSKENIFALTDLHQVELEDEEIVQNVQRGIRSRFCKFGWYSVTREMGTHHFHRLIAEFMNRA